MFSEDKKCAYCDSTEKLEWDHLIPKSKGGSDSIENLVLACKSCNLSKSDKHIVDWFGDNLPPLVMSKYLKMALQIHTDNETLDEQCLSLKGLIPLNVGD
jgi:hypothetical protein